MREIYAVYTSSKDPSFEKDISVAKVIAPNIVLSYASNSEWAFRVLNEVISENQQSVEIDLDTCGHAFITLEGNGDEEITTEFLQKASFVQVIKKLGNAGTSTSS